MLLHVFLAFFLCLRIVNLYKGGGRYLNSTVKIILLVIAVILVVVGLKIFSLVYSFKDFAFVSDKEIMAYVEETHGFNVRIVETTETEEQKVVLVKKQDGTQFNVFISKGQFVFLFILPETIDGDNYLSSQTIQQLQQKPTYNAFLATLETLGYTNAEWVVAEELTLHVSQETTIDVKQQLVDQMPAVYEAMNTIYTFAKDDIAKVEVEFVDLSGHTTTIEIPATKPYTSQEAFYQTLLQTNYMFGKAIIETDLQAALEQQTPPGGVMSDERKQTVENLFSDLTCTESHDLKTCEAYTFEYNLFDLREETVDVWKEQTLPILLDLQTLNLPITHVVLKGIGEDYIIDDLEAIQTIKDIHLVKKKHA